MKFTKRLVVAAVAIWTAVWPAVASAGPAVIRDAEIEDIMRGYATPLLQAAGLAPGDVDLVLVNDSAINAFVAGGQNIFIFTGLLRQAESPDEVIGVLAHEIGHIEGGHLVRLGPELERASTQAILATILGVAAAIASGRGDVGAAVVAGGQGTAQRNLLAHTRVQESAADQAAFRYLAATGRSGRGLADLLGRLVDQELISSRYQDEYVRTHPLSRDRLQTAERFIARSGGRTASPAEQARFRRAQAKLAGFTDPPLLTLDRYKGDDADSRYARAIAHHRRGDLAQAIPLIDSVIKEEPNNPFAIELKGQILFENGRVQEAVKAYAEAVRMRPNDAVLLAPAAHAFVESGDPKRIDQAVDMLQRATLEEARNPSAWRQLGIALGKQGKIGDASVALAESFMLTESYADAAIQARRAQQALPKGSTGWLKADDILQAAERARKDR